MIRRLSINVTLKLLLLLVARIGKSHFTCFEYKTFEDGINPAEGLFWYTLVSNFSFSRKMVKSKKGKQPSFSFSIEHFMLGCLDHKYSLNLSAWSGKYKCTNMLSICYHVIEHKFEIISTISKPFTFKTAHENVSYTTYFFIIFVIKHKESFFGG